MFANTVNTRPKGSLSLLRFGTALTHLDQTIGKSVTKTVTELSEEFKKTLLEDPDWAPLAQYAKVTIVDGHVSVRVEHPMAEELEFGAPDRPVNAKIRNFMLTARNRLSHDVSKDLHKVFH